LVELETDKVTLEVNAPAAGVLIEIAAAEGAEVAVGALLGNIDESAKAAAPAKKPEAPKAEAPKTEAPKAEAPKAEVPKAAPPKPAAPAAGTYDVKTLSPAVRKLVEDNDLDPAKIKPTGKDGRLTKADVQQAIAAGNAKRSYSAAPAAGAAPAAA